MAVTACNSLAWLEVASTLDVITCGRRAIGAAGMTRLGVTAGLGDVTWTHRTVGVAHLCAAWLSAS